MVIGAGPAGCSAAIQCKRLGYNPLLIDSSGKAGGLIYNAFCVENYPGLPKRTSGIDLAKRFNEHLERFDIGISKHTVHKIELREHRFLISHHLGEIEASSVIIACGTKPKPLLIPGAEMPGGKKLFYEVRELDGFDIKTCAIIGGGEAAFDYALSLSGRMESVNIFYRGDHPRLRGRLRYMVEACANIDLYPRHKPRSIAVKKDKVVVSFEADRRTLDYKTDAVLVAIGRTSRLPELLGDRGSYSKVNGIVLGPGMFAIGDARLGSLGQVGIAVGDGLQAARLAVEYLESIR